ncbi:MAG: hypothetical protein WDW38_003324 [Sanguina aurantia]
MWSLYGQRQEVALAALLRHRATGKEVLAACTHLFWNPAYPDVKVMQAAALRNGLHHCLVRLVGEDRAATTAVILGGDLNSLWRKYGADYFDKVIPSRGHLTSGVYTLMSTASLSPEHPDHPAMRRRRGVKAAEAAASAVAAGIRKSFKGVTIDGGPLQLRSAYYMAHGREPALTTRTHDFAGCLDYVFVTPQHFSVSGTLALPYSDTPGWRDPMDIPFQPIPGPVHPSDHLAMGCVLEFVTAPAATPHTSAKAPRLASRPSKPPPAKPSHNSPSSSSDLVFIHDP